MTYDTINDARTIAGNGEGALLAGRYRVVRQLGQGGMGSVWLAEDTQLDNKLFAIKVLPAILVSNKRAYRQLKDEALVAMKLTHPNIVTLRAFEENNGNPFLVMDYIDGQTLGDYLAEKGKLSEGDVLRVLRPIAAALDYAHSKGVVHRDVKPGNVMIAKDGTPYILDFGIAREIQETMTRVTGKLSSGTLLYMSPEQLMGESPKPAQDIYSFAAMAYECLKGEPPFVRGAIEDQIKNKQPDPLPKEVLTGNAAILAAGVMAGLAKKPEDRPASCTAVMEGQNVRVERVDGVGANFGHKERKERKGGVGKLLAVVAFLAALVGGGYYGWTKYDEGVKAREAKQAEERARLEKAAEERAARLKEEKEKIEAEKRKIEAEREKREKELAEERARIEKDAEERVTRLKAEKEKVEAEKRKIEAEREKELAEERARIEKLRNVPAKPDAVTGLTLAEQESRQREVARLAELRVDIGIKYDDAKEKMGRLAAYRGEPDEFKVHIDNADAKWRIIEAMERNPATVAEAEASLKSATDAENAIAKELHWLSTNKTARDGAKAIEAEIAREIDPELKRFKADDYARNLFRDGDSRRRDGNAALADGDFPAAKKKLDEAKAKLSEAAANAKKFCIDTHLNTAKKWVAASKWQQCVEECDTVLAWDSDNVDAKKIKAEAEGHLVPTAKIVAMIDGSEVFGAKVDDGKQIHTTPVKWTLRKGNTYGPYNVTYESGGKRYIGTFDAVVANWPDERQFTVTLKEYTRLKPPASASGKVAHDTHDSDLDALLDDLALKAPQPPASASVKVAHDTHDSDLDALLDDLALKVPRNSAVKSVPVSAAKTAPARPRVQLWEGGPYWATTNIGAETPEDYGYYFWWGDTIGYKNENGAWVASDGLSLNFSFSVGNTPTYHKDISTLESEGWITADNVLAPQHDAAHVQWGGGWRMPTKQELTDLESKCDWEWTTLNGVKGYRIRGKGTYASVSIFLPCAGYCRGASLSNSGSDGNYWSSVPYSGSSDDFAYELYFDSGHHNTIHYCRFYGQSVRPVQGFAK